MKSKTLTTLILSISLLLALTTKAQVFVSDFHKTHTGQIVFNQETNPDIKSAKDFMTDFTSKDDITAYVFMPKKIQEYDVPNRFDPSQIVKNVERKYYLKYFIDDTEQEFSKVYGGALNSDREGTTAFTNRVLRKSGNVDNNDLINKIIKLNGGKHKIRIEMWAGSDRNISSKEPIAKGEFNLEKIVPVEPSTGKYANIKAGMKNPALEQQVLKVLTAHATAEAWAEKFSKPKIISADWEIVRQEWPKKILHRAINVVMYATFPNGKCKASYFSFKQDYDGAKYSNTLQFNGVGPTDIVDCE